VTLIRDFRPQLGPGPRVHAFIAGVSEYVHLPAADQPATATTFGLRRLTSAARSAFAFFAWLEKNRDNLSAKVATIHLLLSPSQAELAAEPAMAALGVRACSRDEFAADYQGWRALLEPADVALFYFAGHGAHRSRRDGVLLFEDFNPDPTKGAILANAAEVSNLIDGLAPNPVQPVTAGKQLFFVDSCRVEPKEFSKFEDVRAADLTQIMKGAHAPPDERDLAVFYAAMPGERAFAVPGDRSLFSRALLRCLDRDAAAPADHEDELGQVPWVISADSIHIALRDHFDVLSESPAKNSVQHVHYEPRTKQDLLIRTLTEVPEVEIVVEIEPANALAATSVTIIHLETQQKSTLPTPLDPHPWSKRLDGGLYSINYEVADPATGFVSRPGKAQILRPPRETFKRKVTP
jgi:hypothetical protein